MAQTLPRLDYAPSLSETLARTVLCSVRFARVVSALAYTEQMATGRYCSHEYSHHEKQGQKKCEGNIISSSKPVSPALIRLLYVTDIEFHY